MGQYVHGQEQPVEMPTLDRSNPHYTPQAEYAKEGEYPEAHAEASEGWKAAFDHAARHNNSVKAACLYADAHEADH
jgi:hypothetical protein